MSSTGLGSEAAAHIAGSDDVDIVLNAVMGAAGLKASIAALLAGKHLALANKESLVTAGRVCLSALETGGGTLAPVDSEHAALTQAIGDSPSDLIARIVITASGGPFRTRKDLEGVSVDEALAHPTWSMGRKITIDSATLMNKGLEVIEAHYLFGLDYDRIDVIVHPQSVVHGIVEFIDGSQILQAGPPDMRIPIQAALLLQQARTEAFDRIDLGSVSEINFEAVDHERFPSLRLAYEAGRKAQNYPAVLNAANEVAVQAFLDGKISFTDIPAVVSTVMDAHEPGDDSTLDAVLEADTWARDVARRECVRAEGAAV